MSTITTRAGKGSPLTNTELDANFSALNTDKLELGQVQSAGTANGVAYLNGSKVLTTGSALTFDGTNLTNSSTYPALYLNDTTPVNGFNFALSNGGSYWQYAEIGIYDVTSSQKAYAYTGGASGFHRWYQNGSEQMRLTSTGLGIGTSSPQAKFVVSNAGAAGIEMAGSGGNYGPYLQSYNRSGSAYTSLEYFASSHYWYKYSAIAMTLDSSGNLGLGVTPSAWGGAASMDFSGNFTVSGYAASIGYNFYYNAGYKYKASAPASRYEPNNGSHKWYIAPSGTAGNAITFTQAMTLDASGNLNLGLTSGTARASIVGGALSTNNGVSISNGLTNGRLITGSSNVNSIHTYYGNEFLEVSVGSSHIVGTVYDGTYASPNMRFFTDSTERMRIDSSGNVGIGTGSPSQKLEVASSNSAGSYATIRLNSPYYNYFDFVNDGGLAFKRGTSEYMRIDSSGNVGIGTSSPDSGGGAARWLTLNSSSSYTGGVIYQVGGVRQFLQYQDNDNLFAHQGAGSNVGQKFLVGGSERMRIDSSGNVGIGTSSPTNYSGYKTLTIDGTTGGVIDINVSGTRRLSLYGNSDGATLEALSTYPVLFRTNSTERMRIDSSGNVGIGTSSPNYKLHIEGQGFFENGIRLGNSYSAIEVETGAYGLFLSGAQGALNHLFINSSGNVGIGTSSPSQKFVVSNAGADNIVMCENSSASIQMFMQATSGTGSVGTLTNHAVQFLQNNTERMRIDSSGNLLVGTTSGGGSNSNSFTIEPVSSGAYGVVNHANGTASGQKYFWFMYNGAGIGSITQNGTTATAYNTSSDYRLKENIQPMQNALDVVAQLNPVTYTWKADGSDGQGFIAHELQAVVPDCVTGEKDAVDAEGNPVYQGIDTSFLVATLTKAIQEQQEQINQLTARINQLEETNHGKYL